MIGAAVLLCAVAVIAYKLGVAAERLRHAPPPSSLSDELRRGAVSRTWEEP